MNVGVFWTTWVVISEGRGGRRAFWGVLYPETGPTWAGGVRNSGRSLWDFFLEGGLHHPYSPFLFYAHHHPPASSREPARCVLRSLARFCPAWWFIIPPNGNDGRMVWRRHGCPLNKGFVYMDWSPTPPEQIWGESERWGGISLSFGGRGAKRDINALI